MFQRPLLLFLLFCCSLGPQIEDIALKLGINVIDDLPDYIKRHPLISKSYLFSSSYSGQYTFMNPVNLQFT